MPWFDEASPLAAGKSTFTAPGRVTPWTNSSTAKLHAVVFDTFTVAGIRRLTGSGRGCSKCTTDPQTCKHGEGGLGAEALRRAPLPERRSHSTKNQIGRGTTSLPPPPGSLLDATLYTHRSPGIPQPPAAEAADGGRGIRRTPGGEVDLVARLLSWTLALLLQTERGTLPLVGMETGDQSAKKPRLEPPPDIPVKQEVAVHEGTGAQGGGGAVVVVAAAAETGPKVEGTIKMDLNLLHCPLCSRPLKPPVFQCKAGHLACGDCIAGGEGCRKCDPDGGGGFDVRNTAMDAVVSAARVECPRGGCGTHVAYHALDAHRSACPRAPCLCTEPGCGFSGLPPALAAHLAAAHAWPKLMVQYGKVHRFRMPVPSRRVLVGAGDEGGAFVLTAAALGAATAVSVVRVRASAAPWPRYTCKMWANLPAAGASGGKADVALVDINVESRTSPGAVVAVDELASFLTVPPRYLVPAATALSMAVPLSIRIERISSSSSK